jgi:hypothetical protein
MDQPPRIRVPKTPRDSYRPHTPLHKNTLLQAQVRAFRQAEKDLPPEHRTNIPMESIRTEADAANYIGRVTRKIHEIHTQKAPRK